MMYDTWGAKVTMVHHHRGGWLACSSRTAMRPSIFFFFKPEQHESSRVCIRYHGRAGSLVCHCFDKLIKFCTFSSATYNGGATASATTVAGRAGSAWRGSATRKSHCFYIFGQYGPAVRHWRCRWPVFVLFCSSTSSFHFDKIVFVKSRCNLSYIPFEWSPYIRVVMFLFFTGDPSGCALICIYFSPNKIFYSILTIKVSSFILFLHLFLA